VVVIAYVALGLYGSVGFGDATFALNHLLVSGSLAVVAVLLGFLGTWEERLRRDLADLARAPHRRYASFDEAARESLRQAASILRAPRAILVWEDTEEPWLETLLWSGGELGYERLRPGVISPLVPEPLDDAALLCLDLATEPPVVLHTADRGLTMWRGQPFHAELARRAAARNVLSVPVSGEGVKGRLFAFDKPRLNSDDLVVGLLLGRQLSATLEQHVLVRETETAAATAERMRLARELHDGITQSLAGAALQISGLRRLVAVDPSGAEKRLDDIESLLLNEQRELRLFMQELRPSSAGSERDGSLEARLEELCDRVSRLWGVEVELEVTGEIVAPLHREVYRLVHEALINAARHAHASHVRVTAAVSPEGARLRVVDDGRGFPFHGLYDLATLNAGRIGPVSLKERVASLRGDLLVRSSDHGAEIEITLPMTAAQGAT
jgi:signal transduction histidine kinase